MLFTRAVRLSVLVPRCFRDYVENEDVVVVQTLIGAEEYAGDVPCQSFCALANSANCCV